MEQNKVTTKCDEDTMQMDGALAGAAYHLQNMRNLYPSNQQEFVWELEAVLVKLRSVPDQVLDDANVTFSMGIPIDERLDERTFEDCASKQDNRAALQFIESYRESTKALNADPNVKVAFKKRRIAVHRRSVRPDKAEISSHEILTFADSAIVTKYDAQGRLYETLVSAPEPKPPEHEEPADEMKWFFSDYPDADVLSLCKNAYDAVSLYVKAMKQALESTSPSP